MSAAADLTLALAAIVTAVKSVMAVKSEPLEQEGPTSWVVRGEKRGSDTHEVAWAQTAREGAALAELGTRQPVVNAA
mgnify:CR=1 FL=1